MPLIQTQAPTEEPVTLEEAKAHLRVDVDDDNDLIRSCIVAAREAAETITKRQLISARWRLVMDSFPTPYGYISPRSPFSLPDNAILLHKSPVTSIESVEYLDMAGVWQTQLSGDIAANYAVDLSSEPARITPAFGKIWPIARPQIASVKINFTAGYITALTVPDGIKKWMLMRIGSMYAHREEIAINSRGSMVNLSFVDGLLNPYIVNFV